ncbi:7-deoxyloganetin glucosyltransferase [Spinacia oleracea]|uniref:Glycosyltransferase n=1 Tax=Spinacia oleracea TaxID=3562 RepID=A0A9R0J883_SPIOL|nr:7-deoxyloganetin glucosyltransferase-like [Spinacia oleracea]
MCGIYFPNIKLPKICTSYLNKGFIDQHLLQSYSFFSPNKVGVTPMAQKKPHVVCLPAPAQGHIIPMMKLAKLLHSRGFYITLVLTEFDVARLAAAASSAADSTTTTTLQGLNDFSIETIPDGLPPENNRSVLDLPELCVALPGEPKVAFRGVLMRLLASHNTPPITGIISDGAMFFALGVGKELGIPVWLFYTTSACGMLGYMQYDELIKRGHFPLKDESYLTNGYLDTPIDWVPGLIKGAKLKHLPTFIRTTNPNDIMFNYLGEAARTGSAAHGMILNTFDDLEGQVLSSINTEINNLYTIGPLPLLCQRLNERELLPLSSSLWKEDTNCLEWLDKRSPKSVIYVNYGSLAILTPSQLEEFAWGLANSNHPFLWIIRSDLIVGGSSMLLSNDYMEEIKERGLLSSWCSQEKVLQHPSIAVFLTHCGWNSTLESITEGVPMICWPFFAEQQTNCLYACHEWKVGVEMEEGEVRREKVEGLVKEMMEGEKGKELKVKSIEWKCKAEECTMFGGSSYSNFDKLVSDLMLMYDNHCQSTLKCS